MFDTDYDSSDFEAPDIDIDNMLDEGLPEDMKERKKMHQYQETSKVVLEGLSKIIDAFFLNSKITKNLSLKQKKEKTTSKCYQKVGFL